MVSARRHTSETLLAEEEQQQASVLHATQVKLHSLVLDDWAEGVLVITPNI